MASNTSDRRGAASFFLDATPLLDESWTGIPVVCANMARELIAAGCDVHFCLGKQLLPADPVHDALARNTGLFLQHELATGEVTPLPLVWPAGRVSVGLSASVKRLRRVFDVECSVIHDISTILQPHYHTPENIAWHTETVMEDLASNDVTICISQATRDDLVHYLGADPERLVTVHNGAAWPWHFPARAASDLQAGVEPYLLVLGTLEPRKNLSLVLEMLAAFPALLDDYRCVFVGKQGWLQDKTAIPAALADAAAAGRIVHTGFVGDYEKYVLLRGAVLTIFPSLFEGFGLPVLESLSVGTPCVASWSSSLPEVGGALCHYFDPCSVESLHAAVVAGLEAGQGGDLSFEVDCAAWVAGFSWREGVAKLLGALAPAVAAVRGGGASF